MMDKRDALESLPKTALKFILRWLEDQNRLDADFEGWVKEDCIDVLMRKLDADQAVELVGLWDVDAAAFEVQDLTRVLGPPTKDAMFDMVGKQDLQAAMEDLDRAGRVQIAWRSLSKERLEEYLRPKCSREDLARLLGFAARPRRKTATRRTSSRPVTASGSSPTVPGEPSHTVPARLVSLADMAERLASEVPPLKGRDRTPETEPWELAVYSLWMSCYGPQQKSPMEAWLKNALRPEDVQPVHEHLFQLMWNAVSHHNHEWHAAAGRLRGVAGYFRATAARLQPPAEPGPAPDVQRHGPMLPSAPKRFERFLKMGEGAYADVWKAHDTKLRRVVAVKFVRHSGPGALEHAWALARVTHVNIVTVHDVLQVMDPVTVKPLDAVVMELVEGPTLAERLQHKLSLDEARRIGTAILDAIAEYHAHGLAHLDLHDENVIVGKASLKVLDPLYFDTAFMRPTATRQTQQGADVRRVRDLLVAVARITLPLDDCLRFERETLRASLDELRVHFLAALVSKAT